MKRVVASAETSLAPQASVAVPYGAGKPLDEADEILLSPAALAELMRAGRHDTEVVAELPPA